MHSVFCLNEIITSFPNCTQKYFVDMGEISASRAFETMKDLSDKLGFEPPKEEEREDYAQREYGDVYFLLPLFLNLDCGGDIITLVIDKWNYKKHTDMTENLVPSSYQNNVDLEKLRVYIKNQDLDKLSTNLPFVQSEVKETLDTILDIVATRRANNLSEKDVLEYFKLNPQVARDFKAIFDEEYQILKRERPELIESWKYYQEFERLCGEL